MNPGARLNRDTVKQMRGDTTDLLQGCIKGGNMYLSTII